MESLGLCFGATNLGYVLLTSGPGGREQIVMAGSKPHGGHPLKLAAAFRRKLGQMDKGRFCATGRKLRHHFDTLAISEPEAIERALQKLLPTVHPFRLLVSAGAETTIIYQLDAKSRIINARTGNRCAAGTGEFFLQQLRRMHLDPTVAADPGPPAEYFPISSRCSVFSKSDCTHALNSGVPAGEVLAGCCRMMADRILELLRKSPPQPTLLIGGCSRIGLLRHYLEKEIDGLSIPPEAPWFEAFGAALAAREKSFLSETGTKGKGFRPPPASTPKNELKPLSEGLALVCWQQRPEAEAETGDRTVLGLDVGSTTTKAVIIRRRDRMILASVYRRTAGDPITAIRRIYRKLEQQLGNNIILEGIGITGSGRKLAALHARRAAVVNEISAHAQGAAFYDNRVETIFEIGGQDAKYISLVNGVTCDYAMNEACSAGTGSFLEEAASEHLGIPVEKLATAAFRGRQPAAFSDQCAAFIGSDIKQAIQRRIPPEDIAAGLIYSICLNYLNRVKGRRPVGDTVFLQGGTCRNRALPAAMALLLGRRVVVPPDPGLVGAFGAGLEVDRQLDAGIFEPREIDLDGLAARECRRETSFTCPGDETCDRGCEIAGFRIDGRSFPFGGSCSRYEHGAKDKPLPAVDLVAWREKRLFRDYEATSGRDQRPTVGLNRSFLVHTYLPFYLNFFTGLGYRPILPTVIDPKAGHRPQAEFCAPALDAHGYFSTLLEQQPDFIFLPQVRGADGNNLHRFPRGDLEPACSCVLVQSEPFYLKTAFPEWPASRLLHPGLDFSQPLFTNLPAFLELADRLGVKRELVAPALARAAAAQNEFFSDLDRTGEKALLKPATTDRRPTIVIFGRPYNAFSHGANLDIPARFAARGCPVLPCDMLPWEEEEIAPELNLYWGLGRMILKGAARVARDPGLFAVYITNFSCGPDSFILSHFRECMGRKPALILELDHHTATAGIETRIEAFLDIIAGYRRSRDHAGSAKRITNFRPARLESRRGRAGVRTGENHWLPLSDPRVRVLVPAMSAHATELLAGVFARLGIRARALPAADAASLKLGRNHSSCRECLPLQSTLGTILDYLENRRPEEEVSICLMGSAAGPCRFGQYHVHIGRVLREKEIKNAALMTPSCLNGYTDFGNHFMAGVWRALVLGDLFDEMAATLAVAACNPETGMEVLRQEFADLRAVIAARPGLIRRQLAGAATRLRQIPRRPEATDLPEILLVGEIYVRHAPLALQGLQHRLADRDFILRTAGNCEWFEYIDWLRDKGLEGQRGPGLRRQIRFKRATSAGLRKLLAPTGLLGADTTGLEIILAAGRRHIAPELTCETILTVGTARAPAREKVCGVIAAAPFGCLPSRVAEAVLNGLIASENNRHRPPFLALECDGTPFSETITNQLEIFLLRARRFQTEMERKATSDIRKTG